jgi:hypothetical protein
MALLGALNLSDVPIKNRIDHTEDDMRQRRSPHREAAADHHQSGSRRRADKVASAYLSSGWLLNLR